MDKFIQKYSQDVIGTLNGWDRIRIRGTLRALAFVGGMMKFFWHAGVLLRDFGDFAEQASRRIKDACEEAAQRLNRPIRYLPSASTSKEELAAEIARADGVQNGLVALLTCVEPCTSYVVYRDRERQKLVLRPAFRKCLHFYHYWMDPDFGLMSARVQTWLPFTIHLCLNGRSWLARQMDRLGMAYRRERNCFLWFQDPAGAQRVMDRLLRLNWPAFLDKMAVRANPGLSDVLHGFPASYYWSADQTEWASDVMFRKPSDLAAIYPALARGAITAFDGYDVLRFLGKRPEGNTQANVTSHYRRRVQGLRVKHTVGDNSVKMYDKQGSVLRVETTINSAKDMRVYRSPEGDSDGPKSWHTMRKGVVDLRRRGEVSQRCNERYYEAITAIDTSTPLRDLIAPICRPTTLGRQRIRGLRPWADEDLCLLRIINRAEFATSGFRNRDLAGELYPATSANDARRSSGRVNYRLRLLRAHHLIKKVPHTHRYQLTSSGRQIITAILQAQDVPLSQLLNTAA
jgi:hypothetical protein